MKIYRCNNSRTYIWGQHIPLGAWYGQDHQSWWFCTVHGKSEDNSLTLYRFDGTRWVKGVERSNTTLQVCVWAEHYGLWWTKCHWFKEEDKEKSLVAKQELHKKRYQSLMKTDRHHKKGGNGIRLDKENYYAQHTFTDYECTSRPMHDFA